MIDEQTTPLKPTEGKRLPLPGEPIPMTDDERSTKYSELYELWTECAWSPQDIALRAADWREYDCDERPAARNWPIRTFDGKGHSSAVRLPLLRAFADTWVSQVGESVFAERPLIAVDPQYGDTDPERARRVEQFMGYAYESVMRYPTVADEWALRCCIEGTGVLHIPCRKRDPFLLSRADDKTGIQDGQFTTVSDGPRPEVIPLDRFRCYPNDVSDIQDAWGVFYEYRIALPDLAKGRKGKKGQPAKYQITDDEWQRIKQGDTPSSVAEEKPAQSENRKTRIVAVDVYCRYEYADGQPALPVVFTILPEHNLLIRATPSSTGDVRPFVLMKARKTGKRLIGLPLNRVLEQIMGLINTRINQMVNHTTLRHLLSITPFFTPDVGADLNAPWLGRPLPVRDVNGAKWLDIGPDLDALPQIQFFLDLCERMTGINSNAMGLQLPGARTATEVGSINTQGSRIFREQTELMAAAHVEAAEVIAWQYYLNGPAEHVYTAKPTRQELAELGFAEKQPSAPAPPPQTLPTGEMSDMTDAMPPAPMDMGAGMPVMPDVPPEMGAPMVPMDAGMDTGMPLNAPQMPVEGDGAMPPSPEPQPEPPAYIQRTVSAEDFAPGLAYSVRGSGAHMDRSSEVQEALLVRQTFMEDPLVMGDAARLWQLDSDVVTALRRPNPEDYLGPKPDAGTSIPNLMAAQMPPAPPEPQPAPPDNSPKISIALPFPALPADAQAGLLDMIGLPSGGAANGESAPPDQMALEEMKLQSRERTAIATAKARPDTGAGPAGDMGGMGGMGDGAEPVDQFGGMNG